jgi:hypothetical protein
MTKVQNRTGILPTITCNSGKMLIENEEKPGGIGGKPLHIL